MRLSLVVCLIEDSTLPKVSVTGVLVAMRLDRSSSEPIHRQIAANLRDAIEHKRLASGSKLPSTRIFAAELGVSRNTVLQVFEDLTEEGLLTSKVGAGTFVSSQTSGGIIESDSEEVLCVGAVEYPFRSLSRRGKHLVFSSTDEFDERPAPFTPDLPDLREFPIKTWLRLLSETSGRLTGEILADTSNAGYLPLRQALTQHLNASKGMSCSFEQIVITTGSQQSLDLVCRLMMDAGDPVWMEEPGYVGARAVILANGGTIYPVAVDDDGMRTADAERDKPVPRLIFVSPERHYPLGWQLSMRRRTEIIALANRYGSWIVEDDYDREFRYEGDALPALFGLDQNERTFHIGTFSKILLPSFRLGYVVVPRDFVSAFSKARAIVDRHASLIEQMVLSEFMHRGLLAAHIRRMRVLYRARQEQLISGLTEIFGAASIVPTIHSGMHLVMRLTDDCEDRRLVKIASDGGLTLRPLSPYYAGKQKRQGLILGFSSFNAPEIDFGLRRLTALRELIAPNLQTS